MILRTLVLIFTFSMGAVSASTANNKVFTAPVKWIPKKINPYSGNSLSLNKILNQIASNLVQLDETLFPVPALAESWKVQGNKITFKLNKEAKFHDGATVTSKDILNTFKTSLREKSDLTNQIQGFKNCLKTSNCKSFKILNDREFEITLNNSNTLGFLRKISCTEGVIFKRSKSGRFIGTGPYIISKHNGSEIELTRKSSDTFFDKILVKRYSDQEAVKAFLNKKIDFLSNADFKVSSKELSSKFLRQNMTAVTFGLVFNLKTGPFASLKNRKILAKLIQKDIFSKQYGSEVIPAGGMIPKGFVGYSQFKKKPSPVAINKNTKKQKVVLALRHKYKENKALTEYLPKILKKMNLDVEIVHDDFSKILKEFRKTNNKYHLTFKGESPRNFDSASSFLPYIKGQFSNITNYQNDELSKLYVKAAETSENSKKLKILNRMQEIIKEDVPVIPLVHPVFANWYQNNVKVKNYSKNSIRFWDFPFYSFYKSKINEGGRL